MRTTLTLDDDVAAMLAEAVRQRRSTLRQVVNEALREGLAPTAPASGTPFCTPTFSVGGLLIGSVASTSEMLAIAEGEGHS